LSDNLVLRLLGRACDLTIFSAAAFRFLVIGGVVLEALYASLVVGDETGKDAGYKGGD
jgi:hypothetical protein